jgi:hypothetical protein
MQTVNLQTKLHLRCKILKPNIHGIRISRKLNPLLGIELFDFQIL